MTKNPKTFGEMARGVLLMTGGALLGLLILLFIVLSAPVYLFRFLSVWLAKVFRPDLDDIMDPVSNAMVNDYFTKTNPRANCLAPIYFRGHLTTAELKLAVQRGWIECRDETSRRNYRKFQQHPERWLGFTFWKSGSQSFSIDNHVETISGPERLVTDDQLTGMLEKLVNSSWPKDQSPWKLYVIENFKMPNSSERHSLFILSFHHCLTDGFGMLTALFEGIFETVSLDKMNLPDGRIPHKPRFQMLLYLLTIPITAFKELSYLLSHQFKSCPFVMSDKNKKWFQVCEKTPPIPVQAIKSIKNKFGVAFTSVLLSAVSAALYKSLQRSKTLRSQNESALCGNALPASGTSKRKELSNRVTCALFDMPTKAFESPVTRLRTVDRIMTEIKGSVVPLLMQYIPIVCGAHFNSVCEAILSNRRIPIGVSNVSGIPFKVALNGKELVHYEAVCGGLQGDVGAAISILSYEKVITIGVVVEQGLMSKQEVKQFTKFIMDEIELLGECAEKGGQDW